MNGRQTAYSAAGKKKGAGSGARSAGSGAGEADSITEDAGQLGQELLGALLSLTPSPEGKLRSQAL